MEAYHAKKIEEIFGSLDSSDKGLRADEAHKRLVLHGPNKLPDDERMSLFLLFFRQLHSWFIYILLLAAVISFFFSKALDAYIIIAIIIINAIIGFVQEHRAERAVRALKSLIVQKAKALRNGIVDEIFAEDIV